MAAVKVLDGLVIGEMSVEWPKLCVANWQLETKARRMVFPSPLNGERVRVRGENVVWRSILELRVDDIPATASSFIFNPHH